MDPNLEISKLLQAHLARARAKNPTYSLRALARRLHSSPSMVSDILAGKRSLSKRSAERILLQLGIPEKRRMIVIRNIISRRSSSTPNNTTGEKRPEFDDDYAEIEMDQLKVLSEWYYFGVYVLAETAEFRADAAWIAKKIGITIPQARRALIVLQRCKLLVMSENGRIVPSGKSITTSLDVPSEVIRNRHRQHLELAHRSLQKDKVEQRDFSTIIIPSSGFLFLEAKARIQNFRRELANFLETMSPEQKTQVFMLNVQLFELTR